MSLLPETLGPFQIVEALTTDGSVSSWRALDTRTQQEVILYVLDRQDQDPTFVQQFQAEARVAIQLQHDAILAVRETGELDRYSYAMTEPLIGMTSLAAYLRQWPVAFVADEVATLVQSIAAALDYAHAQGVLHLALDPSEIWLTGTGLGRLAGLGIPRRFNFPDQPLANDNAAKDAAVSAVLPFMAPEQVHGERQVERRADVYSLGAIAYLLLTGQPPFQAADRTQLAKQILRYVPLPAHQLKPELPATIVFVLKVVLDKNPNLRYASAGQFATALSQAQRWSAALPAHVSQSGPCRACLACTSPVAGSGSPADCSHRRRVARTTPAPAHPV